MLSPSDLGAKPSLSSLESSDSAGIFLSIEWVA